jgi:hypothetical protein
MAMDTIYDILRKTDAIVFDAKDEALKEFLKLYYTVVTPDSTEGFENILVYTESFSEALLMIPGVRYVWSKYSVPYDLRQALSDGFLVDNRDLKEEYIRLFLSNC